jgi:hypothetical protein
MLQYFFYTFRGTKHTPWYGESPSHHHHSETRMYCTYQASIWLRNLGDLQVRERKREAGHGRQSVAVQSPVQTIARQRAASSRLVTLFRPETWFLARAWVLDYPTHVYLFSSSKTTRSEYSNALEYEYRVKTAALGTLKRYSIFSHTLYLEWYSAYSILYSGGPH